MVNKIPFSLQKWEIFSNLRKGKKAIFTSKGIFLLRDSIYFD